jgi:FkbM family methyltransferase
MQKYPRGTCLVAAAMKKPITKLIRVIIPRSWRNAMRRPRVTAGRLLAKIEWAFGKSSNLSIRREWSVRCHPICVTEFGVFQNDPAQYAELEDFIAQCRPGMKLLDVGAHWGIFALAALHYGSSEASVVCVEPSSSAAKVLKHNLLLNGVLDRVTVVEKAAGIASGSVHMLTTGAGGADYLVVPPETRPDSVSIPQSDLTALCRLLDFVPTHVKIDIEGYEEEGLIGAREMLQLYHPMLFLELHGELIRRRGRDPRTVLQMLRETGYFTWKKARTVICESDLEKEDFNARFVCIPNREAIA